MARFRVGLARTPGSDAVRMPAPGGAWARVRTAVHVVAHEPSLWVLGALSFGVRGGWLLLAVPIITFPEEGQLSTIFGPVLTSSGPSSALVVLIAIAGGAAILVACTAVLLAAYAEVSAFDRTVQRPESVALLVGRAPRALRGRERRGLVARVAGAQAVGLVVILAVVALVGRRIPQIAIAELQFPSNSTDSLVTRVLGQVRGELLVLVVVVVLVDIAVALVSRRLMARRSGLSVAGRAGLGHAIRRLPRLALTAVACWAVTFAILLPVLWLTGYAWTAVRDLYLAPGGSASPDILRQWLTLAGFVAVWIGGLALAGLASALRAALWTTSLLR
jgi:hypothetical protein